MPDLLYCKFVININLLFNKRISGVSFKNYKITYIFFQNLQQHIIYLYKLQ